MTLSSYRGMVPASVERSGDDEAFVSISSLSVNRAGLPGSALRVLLPLKTDGRRSFRSRGLLPPLCLQAAGVKCSDESWFCRVQALQHGPASCSVALGNLEMYAFPLHYTSIGFTVQSSTVKEAGAIWIKWLQDSKSCLNTTSREPRNLEMSHFHLFCFNHLFFFCQNLEIK